MILEYMLYISRIYHFDFVGNKFNIAYNLMF